MRIGISNIAWDVSEDESISELLRKNKIDAIDIAPTKYFSNPTRVSQSEILEVKKWWAGKGIEITGMQSLLFGKTEFNIFGPLDVQDAMLQYLASIFRIAQVIEAPRLVFGSPKNRDRSGLTQEWTEAVALSFFRRLGDLAIDFDISICLEPNPTCYGCNFMTNAIETALVVKNIDHPAIKMQLDVGALSINEENISDVLSSSSHLIGHVHLSEPGLSPLGDCKTDHVTISEAIEKYLPDQLLCIEMLATEEESHQISVKRALDVATKYYT